MTVKLVCGRLVLFLSCLVLLLFAYTPCSPGNSIFFDEQFNTLDTSRWEVNQNGYPAPVSVSGGFLHMGSPGTSSLDFPYVKSKINIFPAAGDFSVEVGVQYTDVAFKGDGFVLLGPANQGVESFWQDPSGFFLSGVFLGSNDTGFHKIKYQVQGSNITAFLDGVQKSSSALAARPTQLWFGHPTIGQLLSSTDPNPNLDSNGVVTGRWWGGGVWTTFNLDYIQVTTAPVPEPCTLLLLGGGLAGIYVRRRMPRKV